MLAVSRSAAYGRWVTDIPPDAARSGQAREPTRNRARNRIGLGPFVVLATGCALMVLALFSSTTRAFAAARFAAALGESGVAALSSLTIAEIALLQIGALASIAAIAWGGTRTARRRVSRRRGR